jgi:hypothetical protein
LAQHRQSAEESAAGSGLELGVIDGWNNNIHVIVGHRRVRAYRPNWVIVTPIGGP